ncbi:MAG: hypothetical protein FJ110_12695 [Deltaproteobacteria bacterium]|nr:hypothetical protein [Deltaproteobacteria bacterium]
MLKKFLGLKWALIISILIFIPTVTMAQANYVGADKCVACHREYYDNWKATGHPYKVRPAKEARDAGIPKPDYVNSWDDILLVAGGFKWKARYIDQDGFFITQSPDGKIKGKNQFNIETEAFTDWNAGQKVPFDCGPCHTTGYKKEGNQMGKPGLIGTWAFNGIQCEACHGPGSEHVAKPAKANIKVDKSAAFCATCHRRGTDMKVIPAKGSGFIDHREQYQEMLQSPHKAMNCVDCHNPHKRAKLDLKATCATCHQKQLADFRDSKHQKAKVRCVDCHMPDLGETAIQRGYMKGDLATHLIKINIDPNAKQLTDDKKFSNGYITLGYACLSCHTDRNASWAAQYAKGVHKLGK